MTDSEPLPATTTCCIVGGGPGGLMLGLLLARRGVDVTVLEAHPTFDRDFRGDTIHPGILEILDQIGLAERLHELPHVKMYGPTFPTPQGNALLFDLRKLLKTKFPYLMWMAQPIFLEFLAKEAQHFPSFHLHMSANVERLLVEDGVVRGVAYRGTDGQHEVRALLTVGADGRFSRVRKQAGIRPVMTSSPVELIWFRLPRAPGEPPSTGGLISPRFGQHKVLLMIDRADHWQVGYFFPVGQYPKLKAGGVEGMRRNILELEPRFAENVKSLTEWRQFSLLSVASSRCARWYKRGLLLIGDAAHTMTPAAGSGIKYAIEDAVVAANVLAEPLKLGRLRLGDLAEVQRLRIWPTRLIQAFGALGLRGIRGQMRSGTTGGTAILPTIARLAMRVPLLATMMARFVGIGLWRVRVEG